MTDQTDDRVEAVAIAVRDVLRKRVGSERLDELLVLDLVQAALSALGEGWRPIETAPREGTLIEVAEIMQARWAAIPGYPTLRMWEGPKSFHAADAFTHWRPLAKEESHG